MYVVPAGAVPVNVTVTSLLVMTDWLLSVYDATGVASTATLDDEYGAPAPQVLTPLTEILNGPVPAVSVIEFEVLDPVHPVPLSVQSYVAASVIECVEKVTDVPEHIGLGIEILVAAAGRGDDAGVNTYGALDPQALLAVTDTEPVLPPAVSVIELVELVPLHPVPLTVHVYDTAPDTAGTVYTAVAFWHGVVGSVTDVGAAGPDACGAENV